MIIHILVLLIIVSVQRDSSAQEGITEITWVELEPEPAVEETAPPVAETSPQEEVQPAASKASRTEPAPVEHFKRELVRADVAPRPQKEASVEDVLSRKMKSLDRSPTQATSQIASLTPPKRIGQPRPAGAVTQPMTASKSLRRDAAKPSTKPSALRRDPMQASTTTLAAVPTSGEPVRQSAPQTASASSTRQVAGAQMAGPVADRALILYNTPVYPEWAKRDGVEASVTLRFYVLSDGSVKNNILVEKTSGFREFDRNAIEALAKWRFQPLSGSTEQWGMITFNYRLSDTN